MQNGVDEGKRIIGTSAPHPLLYNLPKEFIDRFRRQVSLIDLQFRGTPETIRGAVRSCYQENPVRFEGIEVYDLGAYRSPPLSGKITDRVMQPWNLPQDQNEREAVQKMKNLMERLRKRGRE
jgi:hypothetical protein